VTLTFDGDDAFSVSTPILGRRHRRGYSLYSLEATVEILDLHGGVIPATANRGARRRVRTQTAADTVTS
jgi:hypothetical protein